MRMKNFHKIFIQKFNHSVIGRIGRRAAARTGGNSWLNHFVICKAQTLNKGNFRIGILFTILLTILLFSIGIFTAFQTKENTEPPKITKEQLRQERLQKRLAEFQKSVEENCREDIMQRASEVVDSILIARAKASRDTIAKPPRPDRPQRPALRSPKDSTPIAPLLKGDSIQ